MELIFDDKYFLSLPSGSGITMWAHALHIEYNRNNNISFKKLGSKKTQVEIGKEDINIWKDTEIWIKDTMRIVVNAETLEEKLLKNDYL